MKKICIVGIAGGSASGKTTIVNRIKEKFGNDIVYYCYKKEKKR